MDTPKKRKRTILGKVKSRSMKAVSLRILIPIAVAMAGLLICLIWNLTENRKLANKYIEDTAKLYVAQINRDMSQISSELVSLMESDERVSKVPSAVLPTEGGYYPLYREIMDYNTVWKIRYNEVQNFYVYGQEADVLITASGIVFSESAKSQLHEALMSYLHTAAVKDSQSALWMLMHTEDKDYIVSWYAKDQKAIGCIISLDTVFRLIREVTKEYEVIPFMIDPGGRILLQTNVEEEYRNEIATSYGGKKKPAGEGTVYSYQLGSVGQMNLYVVPGGGILESIVNMQILFVILIVILLIVCAIEIYFYYQKIMEPLKQFAEGLEEMNEEQLLNEDGRNNLLELESASGKFRELLRKIQSLKIAIYEKELDEQKAELEYTQEQIKPHFFLNCLSLIHGIADTRGETEIIEITEILSDYMRYIFRDAERQRVIREELEHIRAYVKIQKLRYGEEAFTFESITDGDVEECRIPSLLLQTLVENSLVHAVTLDRQIEISLYITNETYEDGEYLYICVSDTGNGFSSEALEAIEHDKPIIYNGRKHVGLQNIRRRLALIYGKSASISCSNMDVNYGAVVEVRIPKNI